jgi:hypothetical protein
VFLSYFESLTVAEDLPFANLIFCSTSLPFWAKEVVAVAANNKIVNKPKIVFFIIFSP